MMSAIAMRDYLTTGEVSTVSDSASYVRAFSAENKHIALMEYQADGFSIRTISELSISDDNDSGSECDVIIKVHK